MNNLIFQERLRKLADSTPEQLESIDAILKGQILSRELDSQKPALLTKRQAAKVLNVSRTTLWRMVKMGMISTVEVIPGMDRIPLSDIEAILQRRKKGGQDGF